VSSSSSLNRYVRLVLVAGMSVSVALLALGLVMYAFLPHGHEATLGPIQALQAALAGDPIGVLDLGLMLLIATPLMRVIVALLVFARGREWRFVAVSATVLLVIAIAIVFH
jgi:uncharacterized membrane protein